MKTWPIAHDDRRMPADNPKFRPSERTQCSSRPLLRHAICLCTRQRRLHSRHTPAKNQQPSIKMTTRCCVLSLTASQKKSAQES
jgi:hypothetical protein